jgi:ATP-dependent RNA helicase HelY
MNKELSPAERYAAAKARSKYAKVAAFSSRFPFELDEFQIAGCRSLEDGNGVLVAAPTGAGKTELLGSSQPSLRSNKGRNVSTPLPSRLSQIRSIRIYERCMVKRRLAFSREIPA